MLTAEATIDRLRRDLALGRALRLALAAAAALGVVLAPALLPQVDRVTILMLVGGVWLVLTITSAKGTRLAADSPSLIAAGQYEEAERRIDQALRSFSLFRAAKLLSLHHLALLRHAQRRWAEAAVLCRALLGQKLGGLQGLSKPARLILADSLLEMGDARGAYGAIRDLYDQRLSLAEVLTLLRLQLDYQSRVGAWGQMMDGVAAKVQLAELMPTGPAAVSQALLALAARKTGRHGWAEWLRRRVELLEDPQKLATDRPALWEVWAKDEGKSD